MTADFVTMLLVNAAVFSALFGAMLLVRKLFAKKLSAMLRYALWAAVVFKLLLPFGFESRLSPLAWLPAAPAWAIAQNASAAEVTPPAPAEPIPNVPAGATPETGIVPAQDKPVLPPQAAPDTKRPATPLGWAGWAAIAWAAGAAITGVWQFLCLGLLKRRMLCSGASASPHLKRMLEECKKDLGIRRGIDIRLHPSVGIPAIMGLFRPLLVLPADANRYEGTALRHILLHELAHYKHGHLPVIQLMNLLTAVYWFNPLAWVCFRLIHGDMETICDQQVLLLVGHDQQEGYLRTVLRFSTAQGAGRLQAALGMSAGRAHMEHRVRDMFRRRRSGGVARVSAILVAIVLLASGALTACQPTPDDPVVVNKANGTLENRIKAAPAPEGRYGAPERWKDSAESANGAIKVIADASVTVPEATAYPVVSIAPADITQQQASDYIRKLLGDKPLYQYRQTKELTKAEVTDRILAARQLLSDSDPDLAELKAGDPENYRQVVESRKENLAILERQLATAPDSIARQPADGRFAYSGSQDSFWGRFGDFFARNMFLSVEADTGRTKPSSLVVMKNGSNKANYLDYNNFDEADRSSVKSTFFEIADDLEGQKMGLAEARAAAEQFLSGMGLEGLTVAVNASHAYESKTTDVEKPLSSFPRFYEFIFTRGAGDVPSVYVDNKLFTMGMDEYAEEWPEERVTVDVDDTGVLAWSWVGPAKVLRTENQNVRLLPFEEIQKRFIQQILISGAWSDGEAVASREVHIEKATLGMARIPKKNSSSEYLLVPAWDFFGYSVITYQPGKGDPASVNEKNQETERTYGHSYLTLNAIDGSLIYRKQ